MPMHAIVQRMLIGTVSTFMAAYSLTAGVTYGQTSVANPKSERDDTLRAVEDYSQDEHARTHDGITVKLEVLSKDEVFFVGSPIRVKATLSNNSNALLVTHPPKGYLAPEGLGVWPNYLELSAGIKGGIEGILIPLVTPEYREVSIAPGASVGYETDFVPLLPGKVQLRAFWLDTAHWRVFWVDGKVLNVSHMMIR